MNHRQFNNYLSAALLMLIIEDSRRQISGWCNCNTIRLAISSNVLH